MSFSRRLPTWTIRRFTQDWAKANLIKKVLIDLNDFKFSPGEASGKFHSDYVTKIYNMIGVTKKVFVAPFMDSKIVGKEPGTNYDNAFMKTYDEAVAWLNS